jgi:phosphatidylglycerophosphate synthase
MTASLIKFVPNVLSSLRLVLAVVYPALPISWRLPAVVAGAASDWIDGLIARRYQATSASGVLLDAIADKLFTFSVLVTAVVAGDAAWWQALIVMVRDIAVASVAAWCTAVLRRPDAFRHMLPRLPGKITTTVVFIWLIAILAGAPPPMGMALFAIAGVSSLVAAIDYLRVSFMRYAERDVIVP